MTQKKKWQTFYDLRLSKDLSCTCRNLVEANRNIFKVSLVLIKIISREISDSVVIIMSRNSIVDNIENYSKVV